MEKSSWHVKQETSHSKKEEVEALDRCIATAHETLDICNQSKMQLQMQEETIVKIDNNLDTMDQNLKKSEFIVRGMSSTFGFLRNTFTKSKKLETPPVDPPPTN